MRLRTVRATIAATLRRVLARTVGPRGVGIPADELLPSDAELISGGADIPAGELTPSGVGILAGELTPGDARVSVGVQSLPIPSGPVTNSPATPVAFAADITPRSIDRSDSPLLRTSSTCPLRLRLAQVTVAALVLWTIAETVSVSPHCLAYANQLAGGPENCWRHLLGSSCDWGQDFLFARSYLESSHQNTASSVLAYLGSISNSPDIYVPAVAYSCQTESFSGAICDMSSYSRLAPDANCRRYTRLITSTLVFIPSEYAVYISELSNHLVRRRP